MVRKLGRKVVLWGMILASFLPVGGASALSEKLLRKYSNYQVYFYNAEQECEPGYTRPGSGGAGGAGGTFTGDEVWDGSCSTMTAARIEWVQKYLPAMQEAASKNGIPWELIPAQTFQESGGGKQEACDNNPLGLKAKKGQASCSNGFAKFNSHEEAFDYYMNSITPIRELKGQYPNDPYSAVSFIEYGASHAYASCDSESYSQCVGHMGEPTPGYVNSVSSLICGIQKWAQGQNISISSVTYADYSPSGNNTVDNTKIIEESAETTEQKTVENTGASYCGPDGKMTGDNTESDDYEEPEAGNLADYVKKWAWPNYEKGKTEQMPAYKEYMSTQATYKGDCSGNDCGAFVANIMKASGWDPSYVQSGTASQKTYLQSNWKQVDASSLKFGDVGIVYNDKQHHVILYVGSIDGFNSNTASASQCDRAPMAGSSGENLNDYTWYRKN